MTNTLAEICEKKRAHVAKRKQEMPESSLRERLHTISPPRGFQRALQQTTGRGTFALITEIKKASPSAGLIRQGFNPHDLARAYETGGATCLSVITDAPYFMGHDEYLAEARDAVALPVLRKDFMLDPYQVIESRALGADCILLIMAALENSQAQEIESAAVDLGMDVLVEVHDSNELSRALSHLRSTLIGINNRNLKTLKVDLSTSESLAKDLPANILRVCESGIRTHDDLNRMKRSGFSCFLVGESLMRETDVTMATQRLLGKA